MNLCQECIALLKEMVAIPSESQNEKEMALFLEQFLSGELEMETQLQQISESSYNVIGRWNTQGSANARTLILGGHIDTVLPTGRWKSDPYTLVQDGDRLRGLGAGDMKGGLAAQLTVLNDFAKRKVSLNANIEFVGLADEERYSAGAAAYVRQKKVRGQEAGDTFCIFAEPHFDNIVVGATGKTLIQLETFGVGGHAASPELGVNAVDCMAILLHEMQKTFSSRYEAGEIGSFCCLGIESGNTGYSLNIPEKCSAYLNKQLIAGERIEDFVDEIHRIYQMRVGTGQLKVVLAPPCYPSYCLPREQKEVIRLTNFLNKKFHRTPTLCINQSVSDGNILYSELQIPTILYGPRGVHFHTEGEYLSKESLVQYMDEFAAFLQSEYGYKR